MKNIHRLLKRQLKQLFGTNPVPKKYNRLLEAVSKSYQAFEEDRIDLTKKESRPTESYNHLNHINRLSKVLNQTLDFRDSVQKGIEELLSVFNCDRVWLIYPWQSKSLSYQPVEKTKPGISKSISENLMLVMDYSSEVFLKSLLESGNPIVFDSHNPFPGDLKRQKESKILSQMLITITPKLSQPWILGLHQCNLGKVWTQRDMELFKEISCLIADALSNLLLFENLRNSEGKYRSLFESGAYSKMIFDSKTFQFEEVNPSALKLLGYSKEEYLKLGFWDIASEKVKTRLEFKKLFKVKSDKYHLPLLYLKKKDGTIFPADFYASCFDSKGQTKTIGAVRDITDQVKADQAIRDSEKRLRKLNNVLLEMANLDMRDCESVQKMIMKTTEASARALGIQQASIWLFNEEKTSLHLSQMYHQDKKDRSEELELKTDTYPIYFDALNHYRTIAAHDAPNDPRTKEFASNYLSTYNISSMLDAVIRSGNQIKGVLCCEHVGEKRHWALEEQNFASSMADLVALSMETCERNKAVKEKSQFLRILEASLNEIYIFHVDTFSIQYVNFGVMSNTGYSKSRIESMTFLEIQSELKERKFRRLIKPLVEMKQDKVVFQSGHIRADGSVYPVEIYLQYMDQGIEKVFVAAVLDITLRKQAEEKLRLASSVFDSTLEAIMITDVSGIIQSVNPAFTAITGFQPEEAYGRTPRILKSGRHDLKFYKSFWKSIIHDHHWQGEIWNRRKNQEIYPSWLNISAIKNDEGKVTRFVSVFSDITKIKQSEEQLNFLAYHDSLTGLPNRLLFQDRLHQAISYADRHNQLVGLIFLDLDRFKLINDTLGHDIGDLVLQEVTERLKCCIRESDTIARLGGDEFTIILPNVRHEKNVSKVAKETLERMAKVFTLEGHELFVSASIGISIYPQDSADQETLIKNADLAMYHAKDQGRNNYQSYNDTMTKTSIHKLKLGTSLRQALKKDEFVLYYQPQIDLSTGQVMAMEVLTYWNHQDGQIPPGDFIPLTEETSLILPISEWILEKACIQNKAWQDKGLRHVSIAINLSVIQFQQENLLEVIDTTLEKTGLDPHFLELEITESVLIQKMEKTIFLLEELKKRGVQIAINDFGMGYSSFNYLKRLPIDKLKIDRSFIEHVASDQDEAAITKAIISLGHDMNLQVVAVGLETREQMDFLSQYSCDRAQGYYFSRPLLPDQLIDILDRQFSFHEGLKKSPL